MKPLHFYFLCCIVVTLFCLSVFPVSAQAPTRAKIVFASTRNGNHGNAEIYVMNTDGSQQIRLTHYPGGRYRSPRGRPMENISLSSQIENTRDFTTSISWMPTEKISDARLTTWSIDPRPRGRPMENKSPTSRIHPYRIGQCTPNHSVAVRQNELPNPEGGGAVFPPLGPPDGTEIAFVSGKSPEMAYSDYQPKNA